MLRRGYTHENDCGIPLCVLLFCGSAGAQDLLAANKAVEREIRVGESHSYTIALAAGDYAAGSIDQQGVAVLATVFRPDGSRLRGLPGPREGKRTFAFIAETAGTYRLELRGPTEAEVAQYGLALDARGKYTLQIDATLSLDERLKPAPRTDKYVSPAIEALRKQLAHGENSTDAFWQAQARSGTPLVEPIENDSQRMLVTFLWRGTPDTRNVAVLGSFGSRPIADSTMTQLAGSDVWYLTLRLPSGARFMYSLSPNDPLTFDAPRAAQRAASSQSDPLNPNRWQCAPTASRYECQSMVELPGAPPQPWIVKNAGEPGGHGRQAQDQERAAEERAQPVRLHAAQLPRRRRALCAAGRVRRGRVPQCGADARDPRQPDRGRENCADGCGVDREPEPGHAE